MSGMASTGVYSEYYTFYMDTGLRVSVAPPPDIEGMGSTNTNYISDYFDDEKQQLLETATDYMAVIDLWIDDEINTYKTPLTDFISAKTSTRLSYICNHDDGGFSSAGTQSVTLGLKYDLPDEATQLLQERLCLWKAKYSSRKMLPIEVENIKRIDKETSFGSFTAVGGNLRKDLVPKWTRYQQESIEKWVPVVELAIKTIENKFNVKVLSSESEIQQQDQAYVRRIDSSWGPVYFSAWFIEEDKQYAEEVEYSISYYIQEQAFLAQLIEKLPADTEQYLKFNKNVTPITAVDRKKMWDEIVTIENDLQEAFKSFDISITINIGKSASYPYDWGAVKRLHDNLPLFRRLLNEANETGVIMKQNGVSIIEFSIYTWDDLPNHRINMTVALNASKKNTKWSIDIHPDELKQKKKEKEFYEIFLGEREVDTDDISIEFVE